MKRIIKLMLAFMMPNFGIALLIKSMVKNSEKESKIETITDIKFYYFLSCLIVVLPLIAWISLFLFDKLNQIEYYQIASKSSFFIGIILSVAYLKSSKFLKVEQ
ncbi:hypothetical protein ACQ9BO_07790 [Flavobacterium sp. P21]|uniref:hypothetical protein n=1 Tax=Flavobacterium sp. P21 TaxID=3423948 RepID=UPI003D66C083